ncbi:cytochrome-c oxidase, cbb3-type subunit III [Reyranella sp.]|jgi:cytochrome c oxidase cbb3-type subunit 3|uniref:cytochrome-c oxidase, cbb3-type subunit III n=1 Tax=Reyranella sp. TaxID=1929291 RepID=UPI000BCF7A32|nr:cytochrome-c oxidase, cbb3-type subunit III [Reyranella sp.]OYY47049.1 MAG: cytochrome-c oxidase, cbb3-type subunit III [Rhodospirillales bacterium 35-66-84]OYZ97069.1 MAG: cytochrome-c oxidase, cbb3-type subunit III [Rhodospirillales bacterium 24-66-33]OZB27603.1 MAG: cytochrome-c oxidase, cbb3-type subunit III [Rhodospirillales bacterium 39-66-50]HQS13982.1 cytochrome-c oxidase, cbb3-type subunit III [Reyranella sp.]HQT10467.1 cytochrome-c oxidase, cbb3-type subunit III [Reyranella sp.]
MPTKIEKDTLSGQNTTGHEWDGVKELNTPLPTWWVYTFYACIAFAVVYCALYPSWPWLTGHTQGLLGYSSRAELRQELSAQTKERSAFVDRIRTASLADIRKDPELFNFAMAGGRSAFQTNCMQCHGAGGGGSTGFPNLVDDDWIWGGSIDQIYATIEHGIRNTDDKSRQSMMPRFGADGLLTGAQVAAVTDYVLSLSGKAKATPEGAKIFEEQCVACHKAGGKGDQELGAPSLSDGIWLYGGSRDAIYRSIFYARNGSMPAWSGRLDEATMKMLAVYVHALGGDR